MGEVKSAKGGSGGQLSGRVKVEETTRKGREKEGKEERTGVDGTSETVMKEGVLRDGS